MGSGCAASHQTSGHLRDCEFQDSRGSGLCPAGLHLQLAPGSRACSTHIC